MTRHDQSIGMVIDQGFETMEGASGDDWISVAQSMRAYLRFSMLGGVIARQIEIGFEAKALILDGDVLQPLLLLGGLGEVSRIGGHPAPGPREIWRRLSTCHWRMTANRVQNFCESCRNARVNARRAPLQLAPN